MNHFDTPPPLQETRTNGDIIITYGGLCTRITNAVIVAARVLYGYTRLEAEQWAIRRALAMDE